MSKKKKIWVENSCTSFCSMILHPREMGYGKEDCFFSYSASLWPLIHTESMFKGVCFLNRVYPVCVKYRNNLLIQCWTNSWLIWPSWVLWTECLGLPRIPVESPIPVRVFGGGTFGR